MIRGILICPDVDLNDRLTRMLVDVGTVTLTRTLNRYPNSLELVRFLRAHAPHVIFLSAESMSKLQEVVEDVEKNTPGVQIVAISRACDPQLLIDLMRNGIREFIAPPFDREVVRESVARLEKLISAKPPVVESTDNVFSFLPSKAGVGTSTLALNASVALSHHPNTNVLLVDFDLNSGMMRFMLKLDNTYCVTDAAEHALEMDESMWPQMVTTVEKFDVLHAGKLNPDFRIESSQIRHLMEFARRNYRALCVDLSGNLEKYSLEIMHESKRIFLVCTPEIPSLHLAREKYLYLKKVDLHERVAVLVNRCQKRPLISPQQIEQLLGVPVHMTFPNDYQGVQRALTVGRWVEPSSELAKQCALLSNTMLDRKPIPVNDAKKKFIEYFSVVPGRFGGEAKKPAV
jgi:pilus assembly protein CpaE